jgi:hypothetical protein
MNYQKVLLAARAGAAAFQDLVAALEEDGEINFPSEGGIRVPIETAPKAPPVAPAQSPKSIEPYLDAVLNEAERVEKGQHANVSSIRSRVEMIRKARPSQVKELVQILTGEVSALAEDNFDVSSLFGVMSKLIEVANAQFDATIIGDDVDVKPDIEG